MPTTSDPTRKSQPPRRPERAAVDRELADFLAADVDPPAVDPSFKEGLRRRLWRWVRAKAPERESD